MKRQMNPKVFGAMTAFALLLGSGATYAQYSVANKATAKIATLEAETPSDEELQKSLADSTRTLAEYRDNVDHLEAGVPDVAYVPTLLKELEEVGERNNIKVIGVRPVAQVFMSALDGSIAKKKDYEEIEIEIKGRGRYEDVKRFLDDLQEFPKMISVKTVKIEPQREMGDQRAPKVEATVNVVLYVFPFQFAPASKQGDEKTASTDEVAANVLGIAEGVRP
ncbi:MAG: type 4a pilus biogenesis protein PilO [Armatimonadetes bacterium]|nr:type 4a pilus biogenesis protein PilO [Armatimonadota bacterium]